MSIIPFIKNHLTTLPYPVGSVLARIPYRYRPVAGKIYQHRVREIKWFNEAKIDEQKSFVFSKMKRLVDHAITNIPFYREFYRSHGFAIQQLTDFESLQSIPIICKADLQQCELADRSEPEGTRRRFLVNTGGSTGVPLGFYVEDSAIGHERAHILKIWSKFGFVPSDYTLVFSGRSKYKRPVQYDSMRHSFNVNIYLGFEDICNELRRMFKRRTFRFLHGYPSALFEFALHCDSHATDVRDRLRESLKGVFLGSEFPQSVWRNCIEKTFGAPSVSFYGHTERCAIAYEVDQPYQYWPMHTYGFAEAISTGDKCELVGTGYYNFTCPMIRYNTEDAIGNIESVDGLLQSFEITTGRKGEFVVDRDNKKIPLTGLVFGRHHKLFDLCSHIQVSQQTPGQATIHYCPLPEHAAGLVPESLFDSSNVKLEFRFNRLAEPVKTQSGKIRILIPHPSS